MAHQSGRQTPQTGRKRPRLVSPTISTPPKTRGCKTSRLDERDVRAEEIDSAIFEPYPWDREE